MSLWHGRLENKTELTWIFISHLLFYCIFHLHASMKAISDFSWPHFGITTRSVILLWFVIWEDATLLFIIFYIFLSSNICTLWAANFIVFSFLFVFLSSNVCITWATTFPAPFFQRFILGCLSLSFSSCLFLPVLLNYLFPYLFICGTVKVIRIPSIFNSKRVNEISQYNYF